MFDSGKDMLSRQCVEVLVGIVVMDPIQKAAAAQEYAFAGLWLQSAHPAQIVRKGGQKRRVRIIIYTGSGSKEAFWSYSPRVAACVVRDSNLKEHEKS